MVRLAGHPGMVRPRDGGGHALGKGVGDAVQGGGRQFLPRVGAARGAWRARKGHPQGRAVQAGFGGATGRLRAQPGPGGDTPDGRQRAMGVRGVPSPRVPGGDPRKMTWRATGRSTAMYSAYFLTSERIGFRTWAVEDLPLAMGLWGDPEVTKLIDARGQLSEDQVRERLSREIATQASHGIQYWPAFLLGTGEHLGCGGLRPYRPDEGVYELGSHLRPRYWGQGYATEVA